MVNTLFYIFELFPAQIGRDKSYNKKYAFIKTIGIHELWVDIPSAEPTFFAYWCDRWDKN